MAHVRLPKLNKWNKPPTAVYEDNYGYGINYYQPMIDYINAKERGITTAPPHLPWNNERGLEKYRYDQPVRSYSEEDLHRLSSEVSAHAKRNLDNFQVSRRSAFSVCATAAAANVTKHVQTESVTAKAKKKRIEREKRASETQKKKMDEIEREIQKYEGEMGVKASLKSAAKVLRGKSAKAIANTLLQESYKNVAEGHNLRAAIQSSQQQTIQRAMRTRVVRIESSSQHITDDSYLQPLNELRHDLQHFDNKNANYLENKSKQTTINLVTPCDTIY